MQAAARNTGREQGREPTKTIADEEWEQKRKDTSISREHMDMLVLNFLVTEGYMDAAKVFQEEAGMDALPPAEMEEARMHARNSVEQGAVEAAIECVNDLNPEILEEDEMLMFHMQQQHLIELIRQEDIEGALDYGQEFLAHKGEESAEMMGKLEDTLVLMIVPDPADDPQKGLMSFHQRKKTASELNRAILSKYCQDEEPRLAALLKLLHWGQDKLSTYTKFPRIENLLDQEPQDDVKEQGGDEDKEAE